MDSVRLTTAVSGAATTTHSQNEKKATEETQTQVASHQEDAQHLAQKIGDRGIKHTASENEQEFNIGEIITLGDTKAAKQSLLDKNFPQPLPEGQRMSPEEACEYLKKSLSVEGPESKLSEKVLWMNFVALFALRYLQPESLNKIGKMAKKDISPLFMDFHQQTRNLFHLMTEELIESASKKDKLINQFLATDDLYSNLVEMIGLLSVLDPELVSHKDQFETAWEAHNYFMSLEQISPNINPFQPKFNHVYRIKAYLLALYCNISKDELSAERYLEIPQYIRGCLQGLRENPDLFTGPLLNTITKLVESAVATPPKINLETNQIAFLYLWLTRVKCTIASLIFSMANDTHWSAVNKNMLRTYMCCSGTTKQEIENAQKYAREAQKHVVDLPQQAEIHFHFFNYYEQKNNLLAAQLHLKLGSRSGQAGMHHLYLACSLNAARNGYPFNPGYALRSWVDIQRRQHCASCVPVTKYRAGFTLKTEFLRYLSGEENPTIAPRDAPELKLIPALKLIAKKQYNEAIEELRQLHKSLRAANVFIGYCYEQIAVDDSSAIQKAFQYYESAIKEKVFSAGLDFGRLAVSSQSRLKESENHLMSAASFFGRNDLYEELDECHSLLALLPAREDEDRSIPIANKKKKRKGKQKQKQKQKQRKTPLAKDSRKSSAPTPDSLKLESSFNLDTIGHVSDHSCDDEFEQLSMEEEPSPARIKSQAGACATTKPFSISQQLENLDRANELIRSCRFDEAEVLVNSIETGRDRRLKGRAAQIKGWCLRQRYINNDPGVYGKPLARASMLALLNEAKNCVETGIRNMGIQNIEHCPSRQIEEGALVFDDGELRTLASLYAELGHIYRELVGFYFSEDTLERGRRMSQYADQLNPARRHRSVKASQSSSPKIVVISHGEFEQKKAAMK